MKKIRTKYLEKATGILSLTALSTLSGDDFTTALNISYNAPTVSFLDTNANADDYWIHVDSNRMYFLWDDDDSGTWSGESPWPLYLEGRDAYFSTNALTVRGNSKRVGIGTNNPSRPLHVLGPAGYVVRVDIDSNSVGHDSLIEFFGRDSNNSPQRYGAIGTEIRSNSNGAENGDLLFQTASSSNNGQISEKMRLTSSGDLGIGTTTPFTRLDVIETVGGGDHYINVRNHTTVNNSSSGIALINSTARNSIAGAQILSTRRTSASDVDFNVKIYDGNGFNQRLTILGPSGNVGIGTTNPSHKLAVKGTIRAEEIIVETGWSDYVFEEDYILAPLSEVEAHIEEKGHLPGIPSAAEIQENGAKLSQLVTLQMAKIEELTLHLIEKEKQITEIKTAHSRELSSILQRLEALEN